MTDTTAQDFTFSQFGEETLSDEKFIEMYNLTLPAGMRLMRARMISASVDRGEVVLSYELDKRWVNVAGFICGGYITQALDQAATASSSLVTHKASPTIEIKTSFLRATRPGTLVVTGAVVQVGSSIAFTESKAFDNNERLVAIATVTSQLISAAALAKKK